MSIKLMTLVWELDLPPGEKLVLLALADQANDDGTHCWPAIGTIAKRSGQNERTVRRAIRSLETQGHLTCQFRTGISTQYLVHPGHHAPPVKSPPRTKTTETPDTTPPKPSGTVIEEESEVRRRAILASPQWKAFRAMRRDIKKPVNATAESRLIAKLLTLDDAGYPPGEVLDQSTEHCWQGVFKITEDEGHGRQLQGNRRGPQRVGGPGPSTTLAILRAANGAIARNAEGGGGTGPALPPAEHGR